MRQFSDKSFLNSYVNNFHELEPIRTSPKTVRTIIDAKYEKVDLYNTINEHFQHLTVAKQAEMLTLLNKYEGLFGGSIGNWYTEPVDFELK